MSDGLSATDVRAGYGRATVLFDVAVRVDPGEVVAVLGHNGAGKSTLLKALFGLVPLSAGQVVLAGDDITHAPTHNRVQLGLAYSPQQDFVFRSLNVRENLRLARFGTSDQDAAAARQERVLSLFPVLGERLDQRAGTLSGGQQRMLSIAIALLTEPRVLLLDEISLGVAPKVISEVMTTLRELADQEPVGVLLVEQNVKAAAAVADRVYVLRRGEVIHEGLGRDELLEREELWELF